MTDSPVNVIRYNVIQRVPEEAERESGLRIKVVTRVMLVLSVGRVFIYLREERL